jgi:adhesin/invasin
MPSIITGPARSKHWLVWALAFCFGFGAACDKLPLLAPQESTIALSSTSRTVQANGTAEIRAIVLEPSKTPVHDGTTVTFITNLGTLEPTESRTVNGIATVRFFGNGQSGTAQIRAISGGASSEALEIAVGAAATGRVTVTADPSSVPSTGGTSTITALVADASGNPLSGVPVTFGTTSGTFSAAVVNTDFSGTARTTLTTNREASVTATAGGTTSAPVAITVLARPTVSITTNAPTPPVEGATWTFTIAANAAATNGAPIQSVVVNYGDGSSDDLGPVSGSVTVQHVYDDDGSFTVTATATDQAGTSATASTVIVVQSVVVSISASPPTGPPGTSVTFTAIVTPPAVTIVSYSWTFGDPPAQLTPTNTAVHQYNSVGTYTVRVVVRTSTNQTSSGTTTVRIQ